MHVCVFVSVYTCVLRRRTPPEVWATNHNEKTKQIQLNRIRQSKAGQYAALEEKKVEGGGGGMRF